jgi:outer membrane receptor protein involved in Fe transport
MLRRSLLATSAALLLPEAGLAQTAERPLDDMDGEITVTGTRLLRKDYTSASPIVTVTQEGFERLAVTTPDQLIQTLPQMGSTFGATSNNPANAGIAAVNLHQLGANRTLVLIDGRRTVSADGAGTVDISQIPQLLIKQVEVITGGASAVYGSDAVAGVVNFVLDDRMTGLRASAFNGVADRGDGAQQAYDLAYGWRSKDDTRGLIAYGGYMRREGVLATQRPNTASTSSVSFDAAGNAVITPANVSTLEDGVFVPSNSNLPTQGAVDQVFASYGFAPGTVPRNAQLGFNNDGTLFAFNPVTRNYRNGEASSPYFRNAAEGNLLQLPTERWMAGAIGDWAITPDIEIYARASYMNTRVERAISPASITNAPLPINNPFIPADLRTIINSRPSTNPAQRNVINVSRNLSELGPRRSIFRTDQYQGVGGAKIAFFGDWSLDAYVSYGRVDRTNEQPGSFLNSRLTQLALAPNGGTGLCEGGLNIFGQNTLSRECVDFIGYTPRSTTRVEQLTFEGAATGNLVTLPAGDVLLAVGASYREEKFAQQADPLSASGDAVGFRAEQSFAASFDVKELFGEISIPVFRDSPLGRALDITAGYRYSDYNTFGGVSAYKAEAVYAPFEAVRLRGSYQRAVRAPNVTEAFLPASIWNENLIEDPCSVQSSFRTGQLAGIDAAAVRSLCVSQGIPESLVDQFVGPRGASGTIAGNANLEPEKADTLTFGLVATPFRNSPVFANLTASVDYYRIEIDNAIFQSSVDPLIRRCYNLNSGNPGYDSDNAFCGFFNRDPITGNISNLRATFSNIGGLRLSGIDAQVDWRIPFSVFGGREDQNLNMNFVVSRLLTGEQQTISTDPFIDVLGSIGSASSQAFPKLRFTFSPQVTLGKLEFGARWRHISSMVTQASKISPGLLTLGTPAVDYVDINVGIRVTDAFTLRFGAENVGDVQPPIYSTPVSADLNTDPQTFDTIGRRFFVRASVAL